MIRFFRKNIGIIVAFIGFVLLVILTFGNISEINSAEYWYNVRENLTAIGIMSFSLTMIQVVIKQGIAEQALQKGLNTERAAKAYEEHRQLIESVQDKMIYLPYFLQIYNNRHTIIRKQDFLVSNGYSSEKSLYLSHRKRLINKYKKIRTFITSCDIKWATTEIVYTKHGRIETLKEYKTKRLIKGLITSIIVIVATVFITDGLFFTPSDTPIWEKFVKLLTYIFTIGISSLLTISREYEKGAFGIPNELEEINEIWQEFKTWNVPEQIVKEVEEINILEVDNEQKRNDNRRVVQEKQKESKDIKDDGPYSLLASDSTDDYIRYIDVSELDREHYGDITSS